MAKEKYKNNLVAVVEQLEKGDYADANGHFLVNNAAFKELKEMAGKGLKAYDPNQRSGTHVVKVKLMEWGYTKEMTYEIGGNCRGMNVMDVAAETILEVLDYPETITLTHPETGEDLIIELYDEPEDEEQIKNLIVAIEIVEHRK